MRGAGKHLRLPARTLLQPDYAVWVDHGTGTGGGGGAPPSAVKTRTGMAKGIGGAGGAPPSADSFSFEGIGPLPGDASTAKVRTTPRATIFLITFIFFPPLNLVRLTFVGWRRTSRGKHMEERLDQSSRIRICL